ncbi:sugar phosphate isomerase/epimerase family protein [Bryobacter aggregatus]|uniref:sugar phosphate isomerase/epimerase family protein n=1 Tax=Bryobacter aggregatus TaxID=360054 RepID=UPI0004E13781|nr:sugar phosphate isomerase/epimerase family protein [Bryobacter aggregatus]
MSNLNPLETGVIFWASSAKPALEQIQKIKALGVRCAQMGVAGDFDPTGKAAEWKAACEAENFTLLTVTAAYNGEDYADIPTVIRTVGFIPPATRDEREARTIALCDFAHAAGIPVFACHIGFVPHDKTNADYIAVQGMVKRICDHCAANGQNFHLETGQEPADVLLDFLLDTAKPNLLINFDPANMILYGTGDPIEAMEVLKKYIHSVHAKDGDWPDKTKAGSLGSEKPLGSGSVGIPRFVAKLKEIGYTGPIVIEREGTTPEQWTTDMTAALQLVQSLV